MSQPVRLTASAEKDLAQAHRWYLLEAPHMERAFEEEVASTLGRIRERPSLYREVERGIRRAALNRFPFSVYYSLLPSWVEVIAIVHQARDPRIWRQRLR